jgi:hypothetical protein
MTKSVLKSKPDYGFDGSPKGAQENAVHEEYIGRIVVSKKSTIIAL